MLQHRRLELVGDHDVDAGHAEEDNVEQVYCEVRQGLGLNVRQDQSSPDQIPSLSLRTDFSFEQPDLGEDEKVQNKAENLDGATDFDRIWIIRRRIFSDAYVISNGLTCRQRMPRAL